MYIKETCLKFETKKHGNMGPFAKVILPVTDPQLTLVNNGFVAVRTIYTLQIILCSVALPSKLNMGMYLDCSSLCVNNTSLSFSHTVTA